MMKPGIHPLYPCPLSIRGQIHSHEHKERTDLAARLGRECRSAGLEFHQGAEPASDSSTSCRSTSGPIHLNSRDLQSSERQGRHYLVQCVAGGDGYAGCARGLTIGHGPGRSHRPAYKSVFIIFEPLYAYIRDYLTCLKAKTSRVESKDRMYSNSSDGRSRRAESASVFLPPILPASNMYPEILSTRRS